jgi:microsomal dipeptidase-like Zn-dependent dipeptidase
VVGEDAVALGSDWDGFIVPTNALPDPSHLPELTTAMLDAGITRTAVGKALRDNVMRVLAC